MNTEFNFSPSFHLRHLLTLIQLALAATIATACLLGLSTARREVSCWRTERSFVPAPSPRA